MMFNKQMDYQDNENGTEPASTSCSRRFVSQGYAQS